MFVSSSYLQGALLGGKGLVFFLCRFQLTNNSLTILYIKFLSILIIYVSYVAFYANNLIEMRWIFKLKIRFSPKLRISLISTSKSFYETKMF
jgi:hypothetical protein